MLLSVLIFLPSLFALLLLFVPWQKGFGRIVTIISSFLSLVLVGRVWVLFDNRVPLFQLTEDYSWIPALGVRYSLGVDHISLLMVIMTALISLMAITGINDRIGRLQGALLLFLQTGLYGTFLATDLFLFYLFWESVLIPLFFLVTLWGGAARHGALMKFFIYTLLGSLFMLLAIIYILGHAKAELGNYTLQLSQLKQLHFPFSSVTSWGVVYSPQTWLFMAFTLAFLIKVPLFPFHTWAPDVYEEAPFSGTIFMAAIMAKMGTYGLVRYSIGLFPDASSFFAPLLMTLSVVSILYGAFCAWSQTRVKRFLAYASISHSAYIVLGLFTLNLIGINGALFQMFNHALLILGLFLVASYLQERFHSLIVSEIEGIGQVVPLLASTFFILILSSVALPGTNNFVGEFSVLLATFKVDPIKAFFAGSGMIFGAVYSFRFYQQLVFGPFNGNEFQKRAISDLDRRQIFIMVMLILFIIGIGLFPDLFFFKMKILDSGAL